MTLKTYRPKNLKELDDHMRDLFNVLDSMWIHFEFLPKEAQEILKEATALVENLDLSGLREAKK